MGPDPEAIVVGCEKNGTTQQRQCDSRGVAADARERRQGRRTHNTDGLISFPDMDCSSVGVRVDRHRLDAHLLRRLNHSSSNLAAICDEDFGQDLANEPGASDSLTSDRAARLPPGRSSSPQQSRFQLPRA